MNAVFLDTSFVIALLNRADAHHERAKELHAQITAVRRRRVTTTGILLELGDGFAGKGRWDLIAPFLAATVIDPLLDIVTVDPRLAERGWALRSARADKDWSLTDCISFVVMTDYGLDEALTADHHFRQAGFRALLLEP